MRTVPIVLFDGVQSLDVTGPLEVFAGANRWQSGREPARSAYRIRTAGLGGRQVRTSSGLHLAPDQDLTDVAPTDVLIVPGGEGTRRADPDLVAWLRVHGPRAERLVSVCTGAFLLAEAGLLDRRRVTTHWAPAHLSWPPPACSRAAALRRTGWPWASSNGTARFPWPSGWCSTAST